MKFNEKFVFGFPLLIAITAIVYLAFSSFQESDTVITGIVETTEIDVASKIPGRVDNVLLKKGETVKKGDIIATLESKELDAKLKQAEALKKAAAAKLAMANKGARDEQKEAVKNLYEQAKHQFEYAEKTWKRIDKLYTDSVVSGQKRDEVEFKYNAAKAQMEAAKAKYNMVMKGTRDEEKEAALALYQQASNGYNEAQAYYDELTIKAPVSGELSSQVCDPGEVVAAGYALFTIMVPEDAYVNLNLREDYLKNMKMGSVVKANIPALGINDAEFKVSYIAPLADFATWKPTDQKGDFDLKTFEVHLQSAKQIDGLRPGMTVNVKM